MDYLEKHCLKEPRSMNIYSDNCGYQNKNKYLEKGHTQMKCDSTHALIEQKLKNRKIHTPSQYSSAIKETRLKPFPLNVNYITHDFFIKYDNKELYTYQSRPARNVNYAKVTDGQIFKYCPNGKIFYKLSYDDEYNVELPCRSNTNDSSNQLCCRLYDNRIKITKKKFKGLQELTSVLSKEVKDFYSSLPYQSEDKNQGNKKTKQKTESDESKNNQEIAKLEETSSKKKATNLKSTQNIKINEMRELSKTQN
ncbi:unnamed protein product [Psylliodes chrysocephalus]|uniref:Uncharacterized protein n=1 Tax=Psylliodes chrysocephalus TaxID=3402493 RepID=A0A9P0GG25_9CUCU|nr:unnamed protein product [Psylliodes chrysocephala]